MSHRAIARIDHQLRELEAYWLDKLSDPTGIGWVLRDARQQLDAAKHFHAVHDERMMRLDLLLAQRWIKLVRRRAHVASGYGQRSPFVGVMGRSFIVQRISTTRALLTNPDGSIVAGVLDVSVTTDPVTGKAAVSIGWDSSILANKLHEKP